MDLTQLSFKYTWQTLDKIYIGNLTSLQRKSFLQLAIQLAPKSLWQAELISQFFCYLNSSKKHHLPVGQV